MKTTHGGVLLLVRKVAGTKSINLHGSFSSFLNCTNGTKSRKESQMITVTIYLVSLLINLNKSKILLYELS